MGIIDDLFTIGKVLNEAGKIEQYQKIAEAQQLIIDLRQQVAQLTDTNKELTNALKLQGELELKGNTYWVGSEGPFCTRCYDVDKKCVRLLVDDELYQNCPHCKNSFLISFH